MARLGRSQPVNVSFVRNPQGDTGLIISTNLLDASATLYEPTVTPGSVTVATNALSATVTLYSPSLAYVITTNALSATATVHNPTITPGAVTITANALSAPVTLYNPSVAIINYIVMQHLDASATIYNQRILLHTYPFGTPLTDAFSSDAASATFSDPSSTVVVDRGGGSYTDASSSYVTDR